MIFALDIGNTNIVAGIFKDNKLVTKFRLNTNKNITFEQYSIQIKSILEIYNININEIKNCVICSVVPSILNILKKAIFLLINKDPFIIKYNKKLSINLLIDEPHKLGNDLLVSAVYAVHNFETPCIIIDMGTATTFSVIDKNKNYIGGMIIPGIKISLDALSEKAQQIPVINISNPKNLIGKNTIERIQSGIIYGNTALIDGLIEKIQEDIGQKANIIATGGLAKSVIDFCKNDIIYDEDLVLKGTYLIFKNHIN